MRQLDNNSTTLDRDTTTNEVGTARTVQPTFLLVVQPVPCNQHSFWWYSPYRATNIPSGGTARTVQPTFLPGGTARTVQPTFLPGGTARTVQPTFLLVVQPVPCNQHSFWWYSPYRATNIPSGWYSPYRATNIPSGGTARTVQPTFLPGGTARTVQPTFLPGGTARTVQPTFLLVVQPVPCNQHSFWWYSPYRATNIPSGWYSPYRATNIPSGGTARTVQPTFLSGGTARTVQPTFLLVVQPVPCNQHSFSSFLFLSVLSVGPIRNYNNYNKGELIN